MQTLLQVATNPEALFYVQVNKTIYVIELLSCTNHPENLGYFADMTSIQTADRILFTLQQFIVVN